MTDFRPRPSQREVLKYTGGKMGISAVPGSGKTRTLAELAAQLVRAHISDDQEVLVVTLVNSAVDNFRRHINESIKGYGLLPNFGYRVRTLHGLAHDIVRERPGLVNLSEDFGIIDERQAEAVRTDAVETWLQAHPDAADAYLAPDVEGNRAEWVKRTQWPFLVHNVTAVFIKRAKDIQITPAVLLERLLTHEEGGPHLSLARMGAEVYADYQRSLGYRGVVDFDDLIRLALEALQRDTDYLARLQHRWPFVLEDEAQDSSLTQEKILRLLVGQQGNWVRVGDTNQAIYETFTTADPKLLRTFLDEPGVLPVTLEQSGRSQQAILDLANHLVDWTCHEHLEPFVRKNTFIQQDIEPTGPDDPQPNPPANRRAVQLVDRDYTPERELLVVADSLARWHKGQNDKPEDQRETCAVLNPRTERGIQLTTLLNQRKIPYVELLRSTSITRQTAGALGNLLRCLADATSARKLSDAYRVWRRDDRDDPDAKSLVDAVAKQIALCPTVEAYLWPRADHDWLAAVAPALADEILVQLEDFREIARHWHRAAILPIDQLLLTLLGDLFREPAELALGHKLAVLLRDVSESHPTYRLPELVEELAVIARNERRFLGLSGEDAGFEPPPGEVTVATMHKAKGLEWDRVYLMSVNNYDFPSGQYTDIYIAERWFVRDGLNLEAEALAQLEALASTQYPGSSAEPDVRDQISVKEGAATGQARLDYIAERLRLLYVGITRARRDLIMTWNTGRRRGDKLQQSAPFIALYDYWQQRGQEKPETDD